MTSYYNEHDPFAAQWLRELIKKDLIAPGEVDERSIEDVRPDDLRGFTQCHFFAGIGVWSYALRLAGWPDDRPIWTGSCPCQPFSQAGKGAGFADERHLWPAWHWLIEQCRPDVIFGEQVESKDGRVWLDLVSTDLESLNYAVGPVVLPATGVGAPQGRHRLWFVANADSQQWRLSDQERREDSETFGSSQARELADAESVGRPERGAEPRGFDSAVSSGHGGMANTKGIRHDGRWASKTPQGAEQLERLRDACRLGDANGERSWWVSRTIPGTEAQIRVAYGDLADRLKSSGAVDGFWRDAEWLYCRDGKYRPVEPGSFPLASGAPARMGRLCGYGNAINAEAAKEFILAAVEAMNETQPNARGEG